MIHYVYPLFQINCLFSTLFITAAFHKNSSFCSVLAFEAILVAL